jgi:hypothetical protein
VLTLERRSFLLKLAEITDLRSRQSYIFLSKKTISSLLDSDACLTAGAFEAEAEADAGTTDPVDKEQKPVNYVINHYGY